MLRIFLALTLVVAAAWAAVAAPVKPGVARWLIKTSIQGDQQPKEITLWDLISLQPAPGVEKWLRHDDPFQDRLIPPFPNAKDLWEGELLVVTAAWLVLAASESDGDYHLQLTNNLKMLSQIVVVEIPRADFVSSAELKAQVKLARTVVDSLLGHPPSSGGSLFKKPTCVRVTGSLFYDSAHVGDPPRGKKKMKAANLWELHPVTSIMTLNPDACRGL